MPIVIHEIVIKSNVETPAVAADSSITNEQLNLIKADIVKQSVEMVLEILNEKNQR